MNSLFRITCEKEYSRTRRQLYVAYVSRERAEAWVDKYLQRGWKRTRTVHLGDAVAGCAWKKEGAT